MSLRNAQFQNLEKCGNNFLYKNVILDEINVSRLIECGWGFLHYNNALQELNLSALEKSGSELLFKNNTLKSIFLPKLKKVGAMLGDNVEVGCNSVLNPGTVIGKNSNVYPTSCVRGVIPANSIHKNSGEIIAKN